MKNDWYYGTELSLHNNTLWVLKHHPSGLSIPSGKRSIFAPEAPHYLAQAYKHGGMVWDVFDDKRHSSPRVVIQLLNAPKGWDHGSGVMSGATLPYCGYDSLQLVSGSQQGLHTFADDQVNIWSDARFTFVDRWYFPER